MIESVSLSSSIYLQLLTQALTTEKEEVASLLIGTKHPQPIISHVAFTKRSIKQHNRVEIAPEELSRVLAVAESLKLSVIGWAHSHPHITVLPSAVDLRTQLHYQNM